MLLPVHNISHSRINGPGNRLVIWVQGCKFHCKGCFNPETHPYTKEHLIDINELAELINNDDSIEGITISGGEPLDYPQELKELFGKVNSSLTIIIYSGLKIEEINDDQNLKNLIRMTDLAIVGRYLQKSPHPYFGKKFILSRGRIDVNYFKPKIKVEYTITNRTTTKTGIFRTNNI